ncbi:MAG: hypothetical protein K2G32_08770, partial [Oscillospiraceae bacterium]|nr:hypothetical protein [Oscillospiraceae bacterium]
MYDEFDEKTMDEEKREAERAKRKRRRNIGFIIGIIGAVLVVAIAVFFAFYAIRQREGRMVRKPIIYLYPSEKTEVSVELDFEGLTVAYPEYNGGWNVTAYPDGTLIDESGEEYSYLFWEADSQTEFDFSEGFCVKGSETAGFLRWALSEQGLTPREYNEFIVYWLPFMQDNEYNVISFQGECYEESAPLKISPAPDNIKRVFMA